MRNRDIEKYWNIWYHSSKIWWIWNTEKKRRNSKYLFVIKKKKIRNTRSCHHRNDDEKLQQLSLHHLLLIGLAKERAILPQSSQKESFRLENSLFNYPLKGHLLLCSRFSQFKIGACTLLQKMCSSWITKWSQMEH